MMEPGLLATELPRGPEVPGVSAEPRLTVPLVKVDTPV